MRVDRLTQAEVETLRAFAAGADWSMDNRARKAMQRLASRGYAEPYGRVFQAGKVFQTGKPFGFRLTRPAHEILHEFGVTP